MKPETKQDGNRPHQQAHKRAQEQPEHRVCTPIMDEASTRACNASLTRPRVCIALSLLAAREDVQHCYWNCVREERLSNHANIILTCHNLYGGHVIKVSAA